MTLRLLAAACLLGALLWFLDRRVTPRAELALKQSRVLSMASEDVIGLTIRRDRQRLSLVREDGTWFSHSPIRARMATGEIERLLSAIEAMPRREIITEAERKQRGIGLADYGLLHPRVTVKVRTARRTEEFAVGHDAPLGDLVYVKCASEPVVIGTPRGVVDVMPTDLTSIRDRVVVHGDAASTERLEIEHGEQAFIRVVRSDGAWRLQEQQMARASSQHVTEMLDALYSCRVEAFVWDPKSDTTGEGPAVDSATELAGLVERYRLSPDEATARISVWQAGDGVGQELIVGKPVDDQGKRVYAKLRDLDSIFTIPRQVVDDFSVTPNDLRAKGLLLVDPSVVTGITVESPDARLVLRKDDRSGWTIVAPVRWKADDLLVESLVRRITRLRAARFLASDETRPDVMHNPPDLRIDVAEGRPANGVASSATAGDDWLSLWRTDGGPAFGMLDAVNAQFEIERAEVDHLDLWSPTPLAFRDRTMLAIPPENVIRLSMRRDGAVQALSRDEDGAWSAVEPAGAEVDEAVVRDLLFFISNLRALRIEAHAAPDLASYGLDRQANVLTVGLTGQEGIQKTIVVGRNDDEGVYSMIQGQDVVFVLDRLLVGRLFRDLVHAP